MCQTRHGKAKGSENVNNRDDRKTENIEEEPVYDDLIVLSDEEGNEEQFRILIDDLFVQDRQYIVLVPVEDEDDDEAEIVILRVDVLNEDEVTLSTIDDEDEWEDVIEAFEELDAEGAFGEYDIEVEGYSGLEGDEEPEE